MGFSEEKRLQIKEFMLNLINNNQNPYDETLDFYNTSRQTLNKYLNELVKENILEVYGGKTRKKYKLKVEQLGFEIEVNEESDEQDIYEVTIKKNIGELSENVLNILEYACTEIINNVIDHSQSKKMTIYLNQDYFCIYIFVLDDGIGIFKKIMKDFELNNEDEAIFELSKGKLTSDKTKHSGEGIFFSSRACDGFRIFSSGKLFSSEDNKDSLVSHFKAPEVFQTGTTVAMRIERKSSKNLVDIFKKYQDEFQGFSKTEIRIKLAEQISKTLMSRSQAKRVMANCKNFREIVLDFKDVSIVGQGFCDEIFRVYKNNNKDLKITIANVNDEVKFMIERAIKTANEMESE